MRAFLVCYVIGVLALNFQLDNPIVFYLALTAFPVTIYLVVSSSKKDKTNQQKQKATIEKNNKIEVVQNTTVALGQPHASRGSNS